MTHFIYFSEDVEEIDYFDNALECNCNSSFIEMFLSIMKNNLSKEGIIHSYIE